MCSDDPQGWDSDDSETIVTFWLANTVSFALEPHAGQSLGHGKRQDLTPLHSDPSLA